MENNGKKLRTNYIFIDYENVQPTCLELVRDHPFKVFVFVGANQTKISLDLATALQSLGSNAEYVRIEGNGPNALDFHIAFYLGQLLEKDSNGYFHIISKDTGFDPLINHLRNRKALIQRHKQITDIPLLKISNSKSVDEKIESIIHFLGRRGNARPRKFTTLSNSINSLFMKTLQAEELDKLIKELVRREVVTIEDTKVHYKLPNEQP